MKSEERYLNMACQAQTLRGELEQLTQEYITEVAFSENVATVDIHRSRMNYLRNEILNVEDEMATARNHFTKAQLDDLRDVFKTFCKKGDENLKMVECNYCEEMVDKVRPSPFMADIGNSMCKGCWDMTKEEYANSNGEYIPEFEDYPPFNKEEK